MDKKERLYWAKKVTSEIYEAVEMGGFIKKKTSSQSILQRLGNGLALLTKIPVKLTK